MASPRTRVICIALFVAVRGAYGKGVWVWWVLVPGLWALGSGSYGWCRLGFGLAVGRSVCCVGCPANVVHKTKIDLCLRHF